MGIFQSPTAKPMQSGAAEGPASKRNILTLLAGAKGPHSEGRVESLREIRLRGRDELEEAGDLQVGKNPLPTDVWAHILH